MANAAGVIVALVGFGILVAGGCVLMKPEKSIEYWAAEKLNTSFLGIEIGVKNPHEGQIIPQIGNYTISIHQSIGFWSIKSANSLSEAKSIAQKEGLVTALAGLIVLGIGGKIS